MSGPRVDDGEWWLASVRRGTFPESWLFERLFVLGEWVRRLP